MFDTKSSFILSKLGIQRFQSQINNPSSEILFGALWGDILTLLDKSYNELKENELKLLLKIIKLLLIFQQLLKCRQQIYMEIK